MDVERTIEFILKNQARAEIRMDRMEKRLEATSKILKEGMRLLAKTQTTLAAVVEAQRRTDVRLAALAEAQKQTEQTLKAFINSLRHGHNGRSGR